MIVKRSPSAPNRCIKQAQLKMAPLPSPPQRPRPVRSQRGGEGLTNGEGSQNRDLYGPRSRRKFGDRSSKFLKTQNNATIVPQTVTDQSWQCRLRPSRPTPQNDAFCASRRYYLEMCEAFRDAKRQLQWKPSLPRDTSSMPHSRLSLSTPDGGISAAYSFPQRRERGRPTLRSGAKCLFFCLRAGEAF